MDEFKLVIPTKEYEKQVMEYKQALLDNKDSFDGCAGLEKVNSYDEWIDFRGRNLRDYGDNYVDSSTFLVVKCSDNKVVGIVDIRHELNDFLLSYGGHIGYNILPTERRKGYAKQMLSLALKECVKLKIDKVLITCDKENIGSYKTIKYNGGILENEVEDKPKLGKSGVIQRYWINM